MGLDVTVYQNIKKSESEDDYSFLAFTLEPFKDRVKNLEWHQKYDGDAVFHHSTGYGYHAAFRSDLSEMVGVERGFWRENEYPSDKPFYELINFADNEGCIDWESSASLYADFVEWDEKAKEFFGEEYPNYSKWMQVFEFGKENGVVDFH